MADTPRLDLPYLAASQAQKEVYVNAGWDRLDLLCQCAVLDRNLSTPPASPTLGDAYIVASGGTGAWAGHDNHLALWVNSQWQLIAPLPGFMCWVLDEGVEVYWSGTVWTIVTGGGGGATTFLGLTDTPDSYSGQAGKAVIVNAGGTALEFGTTGGGAPPDATYIVSASNATLTAERVVTDNAQVAWDASTAGQLKATLVDAGVTLGKLEPQNPSVLLGRGSGSIGPVQPLTVGAGLTIFGTELSATGGGGGSTDFLGLSDTPDTYTGQAGKAVAVNSGATALEFVTMPGGGEWTRVVGAAGSTARTGLLAFWRLEEASGNRVDSVSAQALVPTGAPGSAAGKTGQAVAFDTGAGTYLAAADSATLSVGTHQDFTVAAWVYFNGTPSGSRGIVSKGNGSIAYSNTEYTLMASGTQVQWYIGNGAASRNIAAAGVTLTSGTWYFLVAWYDAAADLQYIQVNNGTPSQTANDLGSFDAAGPLEVGRVAQWSGSTPFDGRIDNVMFWKRVLTADERAELYNSGNGLDYADLFPAATVLRPTVATDSVLAGATTLTAAEPLESAGGLKLGTSTGTVDGVLRWSGTDFEGRTGGEWVSLTATAPTDAQYLVAAAHSGLSAEVVVTAAGLALLDDADAAAQRTTLGLGTMATQNASAVAITGGTVSLLSNASPGAYVVNDGGAGPQYGFRGIVNAGTTKYNLYCDGTAPNFFAGNVGMHAIPSANNSLLIQPQVNGTGVAIIDAPAGATVFGVHSGVLAGTDRWNLFIHGTAPNYFGGNVGIGMAPNNDRLALTFTTGAAGISTRPAVGGTVYPLYFLNNALSNVGSISTTDTATAFNTSSDVRLKHAVATLTGALERVRALRPVQFKWNADDSPGIGYLAHELMIVVPEAVTGEPDAVNEDGSVQPQQVDHSKLVPWLTAAVQELAAQVQVLQTRIGALEEALGL